LNLPLASLIKPAMVARTNSMIRAALIQAISSMTEKQALDLVQALGQWADNQRNYIDECDPQEVTASEAEQLAAAELVVDAGETALIRSVDAARPPLPNLESWVTL
jgi:hypothetical protein